MNKTDAEYLGKARSNFTGSWWHFYGRGENPKKLATKPDCKVRSEQGTINYIPEYLTLELTPEQKKRRVNDFRNGVKKIKALIPHVDKNGV